MICPASGRKCECLRESIRWYDCRGVALDAVRNLSALPARDMANVQMTRGFERRSA